jgi:formate hydrogenlyase transcriptional activator
MPIDSFGTGNPLLCADPEALTEPERLLAAYFRSSTVGLGILDTQFRFLGVNSALAEMNGLPPSAHLGKTLRDVLGELASRLEPALSQVISTREQVSFEVSGTIPTRNETGHWMNHYLPILDATGEVARVGCIIVEITAQKKIEESAQDLGGKLRREVDRLQMLMDVSAIIASDTKLTQVFPQVSARIRRLLRHEYAGIELYEASTGLLIRQAEDFPLGKGMLSALPVSTGDTPSSRSLQHGAPLMFSKDQVEELESESARSLIAEGLQSLCCVPLLRPKGPLGVLVVGSTRKNAFHADDLTLLNQVAVQLAAALENQRSAIEIEVLKERLSDERKHLEGEVRSEGYFPEIIGDSPSLHQVLHQLITVAPTEASVLILGETGTGKELIAQAVHRLSRRADGPFIKVNCAAIPTGLLESELFGHEKGAFTGAIAQKIGRMELAQGGTLFLDEVGEIPLDLQPKLLRVLQDQEFERLGSNRTIKVNLRLVAATNRDLAKGIERHEFRSDLFYRLSVFPIRVPSLRERREDIPLLIRYFILKFAKRLNRPIETVPRETMKALAEWSWPGNIRELENLMERSVILSEGTALHVPLLELKNETLTPLSPTDHSLDNAEREHIIRVLRETGGALSGPDGAAHRLGVKRTTLQSKMQRLKITRRDYLSS